MFNFGWIHFFVNDGNGKIWNMDFVQLENINFWTAFVLHILKIFCSFGPNFIQLDINLFHLDFKHSDFVHLNFYPTSKNLKNVTNVKNIKIVKKIKKNVKKRYKRLKISKMSQNYYPFLNVWTFIELYFVHLDNYPFGKFSSGFRQHPSGF